MVVPTDRDARRIITRILCLWLFAGNPVWAAEALTWSITGGPANDAYMASAPVAGGAWLAGYTLSSNWPLERGLITAFAASDALLTRVDVLAQPTGHVTWGGSGRDAAAGVAVDASGAVWVCGSTTSADMPGASTIGSKYSGGFTEGDAFVSRFDQNGRLLWTRYIGGSRRDAAHAIVIDVTGNAWVAGVTESNDFPLTAPIQAAFGGGMDAFICRLSPDGVLTLSSCLGGSGHDEAAGLALDADNHIRLVGYTASPDLADRLHVSAPPAIGLDGLAVVLSEAGGLQSLSLIGTNGADRLVSVCRTAEGVALLGTCGSSTPDPSHPLYGIPPARAFVLLPGSQTATVLPAGFIGRSLTDDNGTVVVAGSLQGNPCLITIAPDGQGILGMEAVNYAGAFETVAAVLGERLIGAGWIRGETGKSVDPLSAVFGRPCPTPIQLMLTSGETSCPSGVARVTLRWTDGRIDEMTTDVKADGVLHITTDHPGVADVWFQAHNALSRRIPQVRLDGALVALPLDIIVCDPDGDNQVTLMDYLALDATFGNSLAGTDLDGDGAITLFDYILVDRHFGERGQP